MQRLLTQFETDAIPDDPDAAGAGRAASVDWMGPRVETHWTRTLYCDLFNAEDEDAPSVMDRPN